MHDSNLQPKRASGNAILRTEHLGRRVDGKVLVEDVTFSVQRGEILAIVGPSGSGKSSLLRLLNRLDEPTEGTVFVEDLDYREIAPRELRRRVGMMTQRAFLFPGTVAHNVGFGPLQRGEQLQRKPMESLLNQVGLPGYADRDVSNLSGGEAQRVSLARLLANQPSVLLLDEPTSALDESSKAAVDGLILHLVRQTQLTCIVVTHDTQQARRYGDRALILDQGRISRIGPVQEVLGAATNLP